ncbi:MAG: hypothetical protein AAGJ18_04190 [Bacteroidota bacterium]
MPFKVITILLFVLPTIVFAQFRSSVDFVGSMDYSYRHLKNSNNAPTVIENFERRQQEEMGKINWRVGLNYNHPFSDRLFIKTGIRLASVGYKRGKTTGLRWGSEFDGMGNWTPDPNLPHEIQDMVDHWLIEIPIIGRIELSDNQLKPFVEFGVSPHFYWKSRTKRVTDIDESVIFSNISFFKSLQMVASLSMGMAYSINEKWEILGQPIFRYHLIKTSSFSFEEHLFNYGLELGIRRQLK